MKHMVRLSMVVLLCIFVCVVNAQTVTQASSLLVDSNPKASFLHGGNSPSEIMVIGDTLYTFVIPGQHILGVCEVPTNTLVFSSGGQSSTLTTDNKFIVTDLYGTILDTTHLQPSPAAGWGYRDLAWNGTYILGSDGTTIRRIDPVLLTQVSTFPGLNNPNRGIAVEAANRVWTSNFTTAAVRLQDESGTLIKSLGIPTVAPYGIAFETTSSPDTGYLWYAEPSLTGTHRLSRVDTSTGAINLTFDYSYISTTGSVGGLDVITDHPDYPGKTIAFMIIQNMPNSLVLAIDLNQLVPVDIIQIPQIYTLGKLPYPFVPTDTIKVPVTNVSASSATFDLTVTVKKASDGTPRYTATQTGVSVAAGATTTFTFAGWTPTIAEDDSIIVTTSAIPGEEAVSNNTRGMVQTVNSNLFSYAQGSVPSGGVGFNTNTGDFVAKFTSNSSAVIDTIRVNFSTGGQPFQVGIWGDAGNGTPGTNLFTSTSATSVSGVMTIAVVPPVIVNGNFFIGVKQTGTTNVSFAYQTETPIRPSTFFFTTPTGGTTWTDFAPSNSFRLMIEANIAAGSSMVYVSSTTSQNTLPLPPGSTNQQIIGMEVVTAGNLLPLSATSFTINTNGSTNASGDIDSARIYYTGVSPAFSTVNQFGATVASPSGPVVIAGSRTLLPGTNYFWLVYDIKPGAFVGNVVDGEFNSVTVGGVPQTPTVQAPAGNRQIKNALSGSYTVGLPLYNRASGRSLYPVTEKRKVWREVWVPSNESVSKSQAASETEQLAFAPGRYQLMEVEEEFSVLMESGVPVTDRLYAPLTDRLRQELGLTDNPLGIYATITAALTDLNNLGVAAWVEFLLEDATYPSETYPLTVNVLNNPPTALKPVTIKPETGVNPTISGSYAGPLFRILNTNYVTIDGSNTPGGVTRNLTITNTSTTSPGVIHIGSFGTTPITNDTVKNCVLVNGSQTSSAVVIGDGAAYGSAGYFSNISIQNNSISKAYRGVYAYGGLTTANGFNLNVIDNTMTDAGANSIRLNGVITQGVDGVVVRGNEFGNFLATTDESDRAIHLATGTRNVVVEKNKIHDIGYTGVNGFGAYGIAVQTAVATPNVVVKNNMIYNITGDGDSYASFGGTYCPIGIYVSGTRQSGVGIYYNSIYLYGNTLNWAGAYSIGICLDDTCGATILNNAVHNNLGRLGSLGTGAVGLAVEVAVTPFTSNYNDFFCNSTGSGTNSVGKIGATDYATLSAWQAGSLQDANSISGNPLYVGLTDLHVTNTASPLCNAGTAIAGVTDDYDGEARSATTPDIGADEFACVTTVNVNTSIVNGWNMISLAVTNPVPDDSVKHLFPTASPATAFYYTPGAGYSLPQPRMEYSRGYWGKFLAATTNTQTGTPRTRDSITVVTGWNMIGSISNPVDTSTIVSVPPGLRGGSWFGWVEISPGPPPSYTYGTVAQLEPGKAYWIKVNAPGGKFVLANPLEGPAAKVQATGVDVKEALNSVTITDSRGGGQTLYFGADVDNNIPVAMYDMPPLPPVGAFDARFETSEGGSLVKTHAVTVIEPVEFTVDVQSDAYPLTISWKVNKGTASYELTDGLEGRVFRSKEMVGEGSVKVTNSGLKKFTVKLVGDGQLPKEYALSQNYPNPFNPTTSIKYALPVDSRVTMEIYNIVGQRVRTLVNDNVPAGYRIAEWDGTGNYGQQLASGVYFLQMSAKGVNGKSFGEIRKLMMLK